MTREKDFSENIPNREEDIAAYAAGLMSEAEKAEFERLLLKDESLCMELQEYRKALKMVQTWMNEESPGIECVQSLKCPAPSSNRILNLSSMRRAVFLRSLAAAAIFILGFAIGIWVTKRQASQTVSRLSEQGAQTRLRTSPSTIEPTPTPLKNEDLKQPDGGVERQITRQNGRLIIETTQNGAETRSVWVVDASLKIANSSH